MNKEKFVMRFDSLGLIFFCVWNLFCHKQARMCNRNYQYKSFSQLKNTLKIALLWQPICKKSVVN